MRLVGYPMTLARWLNRNDLRDGGYDSLPARWALSPVVTASSDPMVQSLARAWGETAAARDSKMRLMLGDLRRLEADTLDERYINEEVARRTGVDRDTVAAVLKAYWEV